MPISQASKFPLTYQGWAIAKLPYLFLILLILAYTLYFSWYTIHRHNTLHSYAADLSLIDQPMWNTVLGPGYFMEQTWGDRQQPRLAEHFEPILVPLALLFFIWDDVRILLIAQSFALAFGALPVFWIAKHQLRSTPSQFLQNFPSGEGQVFSNFPAWGALTFAAVYLLFPHLQAANIADFHADPFVVTPLLFAFWYARQKRWGWMWLWAILAMLTKETLPTLTAMLGLLLILPRYHPGQTAPQTQLPITNRHTAILHGFALIFASTAWFLIATFLIVGPLAQQYFGTDGPIYLANRFNGGIAELPALLQDPARRQYLVNLFIAVGFLPLLAPELLLLGLPVLAANFLSNFPGQYSGEQHYSAPLAAVFVLAAIYGMGRLLNTLLLHEKDRGRYEAIAISLCLWVLGWSLGYHCLHGWTPFSSRTEIYTMGPAATQLPLIMAQIPADAVVSSSPAIHPHLAHRRVNYVFPVIGEAEYLLVDITDISGVHPNDVQTQIHQMLNADWQLLQTGPGLIFAQKRMHDLGLPALTHFRPQFPPSFVNFARASGSPTYTTTLTFGDNLLYLLGHDILDDPDNGLAFRFYWQAARPLPDDLKLWPFIYDDMGQLLSDPSQVPMIAMVWYPPSAWTAGETVITETLPQLLPPTFHLGIAVGPQNSFHDPPRRFPIQPASEAEIQLYPGHWAQLASFKRQGPWLVHLPPASSLKALTPLQAQFGATIQLAGFWLEPGRTYQPGTMLPLLLEWVALRPTPTDFTVFVHLLAPDGRLVTQNDALPTWVSPQLTSGWSTGQTMLDSHQLQLPPDLAPGDYTLQLGLYNIQTLERLTLADGGDALSLAHIRIE